MDTATLEQPLLPEDFTYAPAGQSLVTPSGAPTTSLPGLLQDLHGLLDRQGNTADNLSGRELAAAVADVDRALSRLNSLKLTLVAAADTARVAQSAGLADTGSWLARETRTAGAAAAGQVRLARSLQKLPNTRDVLSTGAVSVEHAAVIAQTQRQLPASLNDGQRAEVEAKLIRFAKQLDPTALRRRARRVLEGIATREESERHHDQVLRSVEELARAKTRLTLHDNADGTVSGHFVVPELAGSILRKVIQQMTSPRRGRLGAMQAQVGEAEALRDPAHQAGLAFTELLEHLPTDRLHGKVAATIVINLEHRQLLDDLAAAGVDTGIELSASEARRLACGAGLLPAVLNGASLPLDLGRSQRLFSEAQRVALTKAHQTCCADGCERPYAWCELHHLDPWSRGGSTDLHKAVPLCSWHHQRIHDPAFIHQRHPDGSVRFHRRT